MNELNSVGAREILPEEVFGTILRFIPTKSVLLVLISSKIPQVGLKYLNILPKYRSLPVFDEKDIEFLSKNQFMDQRCLLFLYLRIGELEKAKALLGCIDKSLANVIFCDHETINSTRKVVLDYVDPLVALTVAIRSMDLNVVEMVIEHFGTDLLFSNDSFIINSCKWGKEETTSYLVSIYTKEHKPMPFGCLGEATDRNYPEILKILIYKGQADPSSKGNYCMLSACDKGYYEIIKVLLGSDIINNPDLRKRMIGVGIRHTGIVNLLLTYPISDSQIVVDNEVLANAIFYGSTRVVDLLIGWKHLKIDNSQDLVSLAASSSNSYILKAFLKDSRFYPGAVTSLKASITNNRIDNVKILLKDKRVDPAFSPGLLTEALFNWRILELLLKDGRLHPGFSNYQVFRRAAALVTSAPISVLLEDTRTDKNGIFFALLEAVKSENMNMVKLLLGDPRCDPGMQKNEALDISLRVRYYSLRIARLLLEHPKVRPTRQTVLHFIRNNDLPVIKELICKYPAIVSKLRPFNMAVVVGKTKMIKFLWETDVIRKSLSCWYMRSLLNTAKGGNGKYLQTLLPEIEKMELEKEKLKLELKARQSTYLFWNKFRTYLKENNLTVDTATASSLYIIYQNSKNRNQTLRKIIKQGISILNK